MSNRPEFQRNYKASEKRRTFRNDATLVTATGRHHARPESTHGEAVPIFSKRQKSRRRFLGWSIVALGTAGIGGAAGLYYLTQSGDKGNPQNGPTELSQLLHKQKPDKREVHIVHDLSEIQQLIDASGQDLAITLATDYAVKTPLTRDVPVPVRKYIESGTITPASVALHVHNPDSTSTFQRRRRISIIGDPKTPRTIDISGSNYGIYCENVDVTISNVWLKGQKSKATFAPGEEEAYLFAHNSDVHFSGIHINGKNDSLGQTPVILNGIQYNQLTPRGATGIYLNGATSGTIEKSEFDYTSWDAIATHLDNGSQVTISHCHINHVDPAVGSSAGIGVVNGGSVTIDGVIIEDKIKGILGFDQAALVINNSRVNCGPAIDQSYGIVCINAGGFTIENSLVQGQGNLLSAPSGGTVNNNTFVFTEQEQAIVKDKPFRFGPPAIQIPDSATFTNNDLHFPSSIPLTTVINIPATLLGQNGNSYTTLP